ncbi:hypothetical protein KIJ05_03335 [Leuconostoc gelidum subsp. gasicomitatum]|uniref:hypothetical protein n=1 Tax=Leuconostoc gasicomitatum TaxID=115778 RepID=UPI001CC49DD6|nr:hypothetical protein [Leuconostoc gasicomitatum]MBZ5984168.1 hypothetical protein [Leuconostoc gasicomitatum]
MNIFVLLSKFFVLGSTICQVIIIIYALLNFIPVTNWFQTFNSVRVANNIKKDIDFKKQNNLPIADVEMQLEMQLSYAEDVAKTNSVPKKGICRLFMVAVFKIYIFLADAKTARIILQYKKNIQKFYNNLSLKLKALLFFMVLYLQPATSWFLYYQFIYRQIKFSFKENLMLLPLVLIGFIIVNSTIMVWRLNDFKKKYEQSKIKYVLKKAQVIIEFGLPVLTVCLLISTIIGFSYQEIQFSVLQFLGLIYSPLLPIMFSLRFILVEETE